MKVLTINTKSRSSRIMASCISRDALSRLSSLDFPLFRVLGAALWELEATREFKGAFTNEVSAMKEGS